MILTDNLVNLGAENCDSMAKIIVNRKSEWNNRMRAYTLVIEGNLEDKISNGEIKEFEVTGGEHKIQAKVDWCTSKELTVVLEENETVNLSLSGYPYGNIMMPVGAIAAVAYMFAPKGSYIYKIALPMVIFAGLQMLYYLTVARNKYLTLKPFQIG